MFYYLIRKKDSVALRIAQLERLLKDGSGRPLGANFDIVFGSCVEIPPRPPNTKKNFTLHFLPFVIKKKDSVALRSAQLARLLKVRREGLRAQPSPWSITYVMRGNLCLAHRPAPRRTPAGPSPGHGSG